MIFHVCILSIAITGISASFPNVYPKIYSSVPNDVKDQGPLILTPLIDANLIKEALIKSAVTTPAFLGIPSYSGFFTVNAKHNSNQFFWYFPPIKQDVNAPVLLWLQGGPGATSLYGLFTENGPYIATKKKGLMKRKYTWNINYHLIYIDNPVGTGFSFTDNDGYAEDETRIGEELYASLIQFFKLFPALQKNEFYVSGESYAGKYVPALAHTIHQKNKVADVLINLKGFLIGNGLSDPINQLDYGSYLYQIGLIDSNALALFNDARNKGIQFIKKLKWAEAFKVFDSLLNGDLVAGGSLFYNTTGFKYYYNYLYTKEHINTDIFSELLKNPEIRNGIHVGNAPFNQDTKVETHLVNDIMQSVCPWVKELLSYYRGLIYNGQLDIIVSYPLTENYLKNLDFSGAEEYKTAPRHIWKVDKEIAGYVKTAGNLTEVLVRKAGHMVPADQPKWAFDLVSRFIAGKPFFD